MQVLLEVIPTKEMMDYEAFTIDSHWKAKDVFNEEYRKLNNPEHIEKLESFLDGPIVRRALRPVFDRDIPFRVIDFRLECGSDTYTYRLSPYIAGKHSA